MMRAWIVGFLAALIAAAEWKAGAAAVKITPPLGMPLAGYYSNRGATGVHDDLWARALALESGGTRTVWVTCDLIHLTQEAGEQARSLIQGKTGIPKERIVVSASHSHTGPVLAGTHDRYMLDERQIELTRRYTADLPGLIASAAGRAVENMTAARIRISAAGEGSIAFNRRFHMQDGSVGWNPGKLNPAIRRVAGPIDPEVGIVAVETPDGKPIATLVNYALHLDTVGGTEYSADYPYTLTESLKRVRGEDHVTLFALGAAGNINHIDVATKAPQKGHSEAARIGTVLAGAAVKALWKAEDAPAARIGVSSETVELPLASHTPTEAEWARAVAEEVRAGKPPKFLDQVKAFRILDVERRQGEPVVAEVQAIALGRNAAIVALPGEIFVELGLAIKRASPFERTFVISLANANPGYVPDRRAYDEGNYEPVSSRCAPGSGEKLVESAVRQLRALYREAGHE